MKGNTTALLSRRQKQTNKEINQNLIKQGKHFQQWSGKTLLVRRSCSRVTHKQPREVLLFHLSACTSPQSKWPWAVWWPCGALPQHDGPVQERGSPLKQYTSPIDKWDISGPPDRLHRAGRTRGHGSEMPMCRWGLHESEAGLWWIPWRGVTVGPLC